MTEQTTFSFRSNHATCIETVVADLLVAYVVPAWGGMYTVCLLYNRVGFEKWQGAEISLKN